MHQKPIYTRPYAQRTILAFVVRVIFYGIILIEGWILSGWV